VGTRSAAFYYVGYNARRAPLSNPRFRGIVASLIDKTTLIDQAFAGYARPAASPLAASPEWVPDDLRWGDDRDRDPVYPFRGEDGAVDIEAVREALEEMGYRYDASDELLARDQ
jgi:peptide/nickel transport system substrate-binding protein